jgi:ribonuclease D
MGQENLGGLEPKAHADIFRAVNLIDSPSQLPAVAAALDGPRRIAIDLEAAGFHRYSDQVCLIQVSTETETFILDPLAVDLSGVLRGALEDPKVEVLMHGGDYDLRLLDRDLGILPVRLFDTQVAAALTGEPAIGLSALLEKYVGVKLAKKYQRADWAARPLTEGMLAYAAADTAHLHTLSDLMAEKLEAAGRMAWAQEEFERMTEIRWVAPTEETDPVTRVKGARNLPERALERLRVCLAWRDEIARARDKALFRVIGDGPLLEVAAGTPASVADLINLKGFPGGLARSDGGELLARLDEADRVPVEEIAPYPRPPRNGPGRATPEEEERIQRLKAVRNARAEALDLPRGTVLPNSVLEALGRAQPRTMEEVAATEGIRRWQVETLGQALLDSLS